MTNLDWRKAKPHKILPPRPKFKAIKKQKPETLTTSKAIELLGLDNNYHRFYSMVEALKIKPFKTGKTTKGFDYKVWLVSDIDKIKNQIKQDALADIETQKNFFYGDSI